MTTTETNKRDWVALEHKYYQGTFKRQPLTLVRGEGTRVWDSATGKEITHLPQTNSLTGVVSMDSQLLALNSPRGDAIWLHDVRTGRLVREIGEHHFIGHISPPITTYRT